MDVTYDARNCKGKEHDPLVFNGESQGESPIVQEKLEAKKPFPDPLESCQIGMLHFSLLEAAWSPSECL